MTISLPLFRKMRSFDGVGAGQTATCKLLNANTFATFVLDYDGSLSDMLEIRHVINGESERRWRTGQEIDNENQYVGRSAANGTLLIDLGRFHQKTKLGREATYVGTGLQPTPEFPDKVFTQHLEIDLAPGWTGTALSLRADMLEPRPLGDVLKRRITQERVPGPSDEIEITDLLQIGEAVSKIIFHTPVIDALRIERNGKSVFDRTKSQNEQIQSDEGLNPSALPAGGGNAFCFFPGEKGYMEDLLLATDDVRFYLKTSAEDDNFPITIETIGRISG